jgi:hypothetical protein
MQSSLKLSSLVHKDAVYKKTLLTVEKVKKIQLLKLFNKINSLRISITISINISLKTNKK